MTIYRGVNTITPVAARQGIDIESISARLQTQQVSVVITQSRSLERGTLCALMSSSCALMSSSRASGHNIIHEKLMRVMKT